LAALGPEPRLSRSSYWAIRLMQGLAWRFYLEHSRSTHMSLRDTQCAKLWLPWHACQPVYMHLPLSPIETPSATYDTQCNRVQHNYFRTQDSKMYEARVC